MDPNESQRAALASAVDALLRVKFGSKKAAYEASGVNSGTWTRFERGEPLRPDRLVGIVKAFWPETAGDWTKVDLSVGPPSQDDSYVAAPGDRVEGGVGNDAVLRAIEQMRRDMQDMERRLSERMDGLEQPGS